MTILSRFGARMQGGMAGAIARSLEGGTSKEPAGLTSVSPWVSRQSEHRPLKKRCNPKRAGKAGAQFFRNQGHPGDWVPLSAFCLALRFGPRQASISPPLPRIRSSVCVCVRAVTLYGAQRQRKLHSRAPSHRTTDSEYEAWVDVPGAATPGTSIALGSVGLTGHTHGP